MRSPLCAGSRKAFTLIELMVVVAIIALLIAILLPSLAKAREQAYQVKCASNMKNIWNGIFYYAEDKGNGNGYLTQMSNQYATGGNQLYPGAFWAFQITPYVDIKRSKAGSREGLLRCPADETPNYRYINAGLGQEGMIGMRLTAIPAPVVQKAQLDAQAAMGGTKLHAEPISYSGSCDARGKNRTWVRVTPGGMVFTLMHDPPPKLADLPKPYCYPVLTETSENYRGGKGCFRWAHIIGSAGSDPSFRRHYGGTSISSNGVNWLFADGHVQWHSASYAKTQLVCCIGYDTVIVAEDAAIERHCKRQ